MSLDIGFTDDWADGTYHFRLGAKQLDELQDVTGIGAELLYYRFSTPVEAQRDWHTKWMRATIRLALIGGGMEATQAEKLCRMYVDDNPRLPNLRFAITALGGALMGIRKAGEGKKKQKRATAPTTTEPAESTSPPSTEASAQSV